MTKKRRVPQSMPNSVEVGYASHSGPIYFPTGTTTLGTADKLRKAMISEAMFLRDIGQVEAAAKFREVIELLPIASFERIKRDA